MTASYSAKNIEIKTDKEHVRARPGLYIGNLDSSGYHHLYKEIFGNAVDEHRAGFGSTVKTEVLTFDPQEEGQQKRTYFIVGDWGRGIPTDLKETLTGEKRPAVDVIFTSLKSSGKFGKSSYASTTVGLNGYGAAITNFLSSSCYVVVARPKEPVLALFYHNGDLKSEHTYATSAELQQQFEQDEVLQSMDSQLVTALKAVFLSWTLESETEFPHTLVAFTPDQTMFTEAALNQDLLESYLKNQAYLNSVSLNKFTTVGLDTTGSTRHLQIKAKFWSQDKSSGILAVHKNQTYAYQNQDPIVDFKDYTGLSEDQVVFSQYCSDEKAGIAGLICLTYATDDQTRFNGYVNGARITGGSPFDGLYRSLPDVWVKYIQENKNLKGVPKAFDKLTPNDIKEGLQCDIVLAINEPIYSNQTKDNVSNREVNALYRNDIWPAFRAWLDLHPKIGIQWAEKLLLNRKARLAAAHAKESTKSSGWGNPADMDFKRGKYIASTDRFPPSERWLIIQEGESASVKSSRDPDKHAMVMLTGKPKGAVNDTDLGNVLDSDIIKLIISAVGCGNTHDGSFDINKLLNHKIVLLADADPDGRHISVLLTGIIAKLAWPVVEGGHLYQPFTPLYKVEFKDHTYVWIDNDVELRAWRETYDKDPNKKQIFKIHRYKGMGGFDEDELQEVLFSDAAQSRWMKRITVDDAAAAMKRLDEISGSDSKWRKELMMNAFKTLSISDLE
jgi:DNA gyrase subunit B